MPMYLYTCPTHGDFEKIKKISERFVADCEVCGVECAQQLTVPAGVMGGYIDSSVSLTKSSVRGNH